MTDSVYSLIPLDKPETVDELVNLYGPVVEYWARHYYKEYYDHHRALDDLRQEAWIGILEAWRRYDQKHFMTFRTYAVQMARWWLLNGIRHLNSALFNAWRTDKDLYQRILQIDSFDRIIDEIGDHCGLLTVDGEYHCTVPFQYLRSLVKSDRLGYVIEQFYLHERTLASIGTDLGVSRERIRQMLNEAYVQIRAGLEKKKRNPFAVIP